MPESDVREVRLFRNNRSQAIRIPADFELPGTSARVRRDGDRLIIEPVRRAGLIGLIESWSGTGEALPEIADPAPAPEDPL